jgi:putative phosphoribosyl transferase
LHQLHISQARFNQIVARETQEMNRCIQLYRGACPPLDVYGRTVILVDDGLATGMTAYAALLALQQQRPAHLVVAAPVCAPQTAETMRAEVDDLVCASIPDHFRAVGVWYRRFAQVTDEEVVALLAHNHQEQKQN